MLHRRMVTVSEQFGRDISHQVLVLHTDPAERFSHIDSVDGPSETYAVSMQQTYYPILWFDESDMTEDDARACDAVPITEKFPHDSRFIPVEYIDAWVGPGEES